MLIREMKAIKEKTTVTLGKLIFAYERGILFIRLPSGRRLTYIKPRIGTNRFGGDSITYLGINSAKKWDRLDTFGGKLTENIVQGTARDLLANALINAANAGYVIKLIGSVKKLDDGRVNAIVCHRLVPKSNLLASVDDVYNAISVTGDGVGDVMFYGQGAGKLPTASAVVGDIIDCLKHHHRVLALTWEDCEDKNYVARYKDMDVSMIVRI